MRAGAWLVATLVLLALAACSRHRSAADRERDDARAIAMVEAAQHDKPPPTALTPQPITEADILTDHLSNAGCRLRQSGGADAGSDALLLADDRRALVKSEDRLLIFAADRGSPVLSPGMRRHYVGKTHSITLERGDGDGDRLGEDRLRWPATLTIRDAWDQIVFRGTGELACG